MRLLDDNYRIFLSKNSKFFLNFYSMHYLIFGKFELQNKPLNPNIKAYLWDKSNLVGMFAHKYLHHKPKNNIHIKDVYYLQKAKVVKLEPNQFEENGDVIMLDPSNVQNFKYPETEISNISLNKFFDKLKLENNYTNITVQLINL